MCTACGYASSWHKMSPRESPGQHPQAALSAQKGAWGLATTPCASSGLSLTQQLLLFFCMVIGRWIGRWGTACWSKPHKGSKTI